MLAITPEFEHAFTWFRWTHEVTEYGWRRVDVPDASRGGLAKQEARLMAVLEVIRRHADDCVRERLDESRRARELDRWRRDRMRELRG